MRARMAKIIVIGDIEKAFHQIGLSRKDRDATRFLWLKDIRAEVSKENVACYRFARVPFGVTSSPFLLAATVNYHLRESKESIAEEIKQNVYVDNILLLANDVEEAIAKYRKTKDVFHRASVNVREFCSNDMLVNKSFGSDKAKEADTIKLLGITWLIKSDEYVIKLPKFECIEQLCTQRKLLKFVAEIHDPLGLIAPVTVGLKAFIQNLWSLNYAWDSAFSE